MLPEAPVVQEHDGLFVRKRFLDRIDVGGRVGDDSRRRLREPHEAVVVAGYVYGAVVPVPDSLQDSREDVAASRCFQPEPYDNILLHVRNYSIIRPCPQAEVDVFQKSISVKIVKVYQWKLKIHISG